MFFRNLSLLAVLLIPTLCSASDGVIRFTGQVVEATCVIAQIDKTDAATLNTCSKHVAAGTSVTTQIVTPNAYMVPWRANVTVKPDAPVLQWKVIQVTYS
jgi:type 1 fimbria pilin